MRTSPHKDLLLLCTPVNCDFPSPKLFFFWWGGSMLFVCVCMRARVFVIETFEISNESSIGRGTPLSKASPDGQASSVLCTGL